MPDSNPYDLPLWTDQKARDLLQELCDQHHVPLDVLEDLVSIVRDRLHQERRHLINEAFTEVFSRMDD